MSRTTKDLPFWLWQAERLGAPVPDPRGPYRTPGGPRPYRDAQEWAEWLARWPLDDAVRAQKARRRSARAERRIYEGKYRAYVRDRIRHGDYELEPPEHITGYHWWW